MRKIRNFFLAAGLIFIGICAGKTEAEAADTVDVNVSVTYGQTEARRCLTYVNGLRQGSDAWYWESDNQTKTVCKDLKPLVYSYDLERAAMQRAAEIALSFAHTRPDGSSCFSVYEEFGISGGAKAENIAINYSAAADRAFEQWEEADKNYSGQGHRRNMLSAACGYIGVGHAEVNGIHFWVQEFCSKTGDTGMTEVMNGPAEVKVNIQASAITDVSVSPSKSVCGVVAGETTAVPDLTVKIKTSGEWSYVGEIPVNPAYTWTSSDTSVFNVESGSIRGIKAGSAAITTVIYGKSISIPVNVLAEPETEHSYDEGVITKEPACTETGERLFTCTGCGETKTEEIPVLGHEWSQTVTVINDSTCSAVGSGRKQCLHQCNWYMPVTIAKKPHTEVIDEAVEATAEHTGLTKGSHCSVCGAIIIEQKVIPVLDKTEEGSEENSSGNKKEEGSGANSAGDKKEEGNGEEQAVPAAKGSRIEMGGIRYTVTSTEKPAVAFAGTDASDSKGTVSVPSVIVSDGITYQVTELAANAFKNNKKLKKVVLPQTITKIGKNAFWGCKKLTTVTIPKNVTVMGANVFKGCKKLKKIVVKSKKLTSKGLSAKTFSGVSAKAVVKVPAGKVKSYRKLFYKKGLSKKVKVKK